MQPKKLSLVHEIAHTGILQAPQRLQRLCIDAPVHQAVSPVVQPVDRIAIALLRPVRRVSIPRPEDLSQRAAPWPQHSIQHRLVGLFRPQRNLASQHQLRFLLCQGHCSKSGGWWWLPELKKGGLSPRLPKVYLPSTPWSCCAR
ncbi:hypothetical protein Mapa_003075 [Marchantia paleacea]|nr:hypothetical protein Mapa_003075 [Marchantia paleacea]